MIVVLPPETEKKLLELAAQKSVDPSSLIASLVEKELNEKPAISDDAGENDFDPDALKRAVAAIVNRTPEQINAAQEMALREFKAERELPEGAKNIFDVIPVISGNETDEQVLQALKELS